MRQLELQIVFETPTSFADRSSPATTVSTPVDREARFAATLAERRRWAEERARVRGEFAEARRHGLVARHATKLTRLRNARLILELDAEEARAVPPRAALVVPDRERVDGLAAAAPASVEQSVEPVAPTSVEQSVEPVVEPVVEPTAPTFVEPVVEPVAPAFVEPVVEPTAPAFVGPSVEPVVEPVAPTSVEPVVEPVAPAFVEPVVEPTAPAFVGPSMEQSVEPVAPTSVEQAAASALPVCVVAAGPAVRAGRAFRADVSMFVVWGMWAVRIRGP